MSRGDRKEKCDRRKKVKVRERKNSVYIYIEERGVRQRKIRGKKGDRIQGRLEWEKKRRQKEERLAKIRDTKYNRWYKMVMEEQVPRYISEKKKEEK